MKEIDYMTALTLKNSGKLVAQLKFNLAKIYELENNSYLALPLVPFSNSVLFTDYALVHKWEEEKFIASSNSHHDFERQNKQINVEDLIGELKSYFAENHGNIDTNTKEGIDRVYEVLSNENKLAQFHLQFALLLGDFIISQKNPQWKLGELTLMGPLNPLNRVALINEENSYFDLESRIYGKYGYLGVKHYMFTLNTRRFNTPNELQKIRRMF